ncbi:MAG: NAD(P)/FAD-dependent oxidoreductase [Bacteroidales bacterium]|nr:NAD(P)/FAD-dependent oxidoreductase [Bacteroidales bacterium]
MSKKVIIIGGGVAGLSTGIYGQLNGYETEILEMHTAPGGQCTSWKRKGYTFDYCIHWLVGSSHGVFNRIWRETGALDSSTQVIDMDTYVTLVTPDGEKLIIYSDMDRWEQYLIGLAPGDRKPISQMCSNMRRASTLGMIEKAPPLRGAIDYIRFGLKSMPAMRIFAKYSRMTVKEYFDQLDFKSEVLKKRLAGFTDAMKDFSAIAFLLTLAWFAQKNAGYPIGGSMPLILRMADRYRTLGGKFTGGSRVEKIITNGGRTTGVRLVDGTVKHADYIIGACDLHALMHGMLEGKYMTPELEKAFEEWPLFNPIVQVSFGIDRPIDTGDHTYQVMAPGERIGRTVLAAGYGVSNYNHDPVITPDGKCVMKLIFESPFELWENLEGEDYNTEKEKIREDACARLEHLYPDVKGHIEVVDVATPLTDIRYTGVWKGAYEGFLPAKNNIGKSMKMTIDGLDCFYLAGQWLYPGGGLPPSAQSGKWAIQLICKRDRKKFKVD